MMALSLTISLGEELKQMKKYNTVAVLAFEIEHDTEDPTDNFHDGTFRSVNHIRRKLMQRIADLDDQDGWLEALDFHDTQENEA